MKVIPYREAELEFQRGYWRNVLREANGSIAKAARIAEVNRTNLYKILERLGLIRELHSVRGWERPHVGSWAEQGL